MIYINGLGYIDDTNLQSASPVNKSNQTTSLYNSDFNTILNAHTYGSEPNKKTYTLDEIFEEASDKYGISKNMLETIAYYESRFKTDVVSSAGAVGVMQLMPATAKAMGVKDSYDPYQNIMGGAKLLKTLSDMYNGNESLMLAAYNAGCGTVARYGGIPPFNGVQEYVAKILDTMKLGVTLPDTTVLVDTESGTGEVISSTGVAQLRTTPNDSSSNAVKQTADISDKSIDEISNEDLLAILKSILGEDNFFYTSNLDDALNYGEYQLLMQYYNQMLSIISDIGSVEEDNDDDNSSLTDLYMLGYKQQYGLNNNQLSATSLNQVASIYSSVASLLDTDS